MSIVTAARRLGLGFRPETEVGGDVSSWIEAQLSGEFSVPGYAVFRGRQTEIGSWPEYLNYSLEERVDRHLSRIRARLEADERGLDNATLARTQQEIWDRYTVHRQDIHRFALRATYGEDQFRQRLHWFWANHFTVGRVGDENIELIGHYHDEAIEAALSGSFADMLYGVATHPAMGSYLDNIYNVGFNSDVARNCRRDGCQEGPNDNLGREILELHTVSPDRGYTEDDIRETANVLSGWGCPLHPNFRRPFTPDNFWQAAFFPSRAEPGPKSVLGRQYPAGAGALRMLTDDLAAEPMTAEFLSRKLVMHFIGENGTSEDVAAVRETWVSSNGDLPSIHRVVAQRTVESASPQKFVWPIVWLFQALRVSGADFFFGYDQLDPSMQDVQRKPTAVFEELGLDFWSVRQPNGYSDAREAWISTEHFDRRIRFADLIFRFGDPRSGGLEIAEALGFSAATKALIGQATSPRDQFVLCLCSREFMEV